MFFPESMTETQLIVHEKDLLPVTQALAGQGIFHQVDASYLSSKDGLGTVDTWKNKATAYAALERQILLTMQALGIEEGLPPTVDQDSMLEIEKTLPLVEQIDKQVKDVTNQLAATKKNLQKQQNYIRQLEPIAETGIDLGVIHKPRYIHSILGSIPTANLDRLETSLARIPYVLIPLKKERDNTFIWLTGSQVNADILVRAARSAYLNSLDIIDTHQGTPAEIIKSLNAEIENDQKVLETQGSEIARLHETYHQQLQTLLWQSRASRLMADAMARFGKLNYTYLIIGWIPSSKLESLTAKLKQTSKSIVIESTRTIRRGATNQNIPVSLQNPGLLGSFQMLVTTYARPRYEEIDPTLLMTITFPLLFGAMFGDVGHGLLLALLGGLLISRKVPALRSMAGLGEIITSCGVVAILFGFLYGSFFGLETILPAIWIRPMENITQILGIAVGAGVVLLTLGFLLNIQNAWLAKDWGRLLFDHNGIAGLILYWSLFGIGAAAFIKNFPIPSVVFFVTAALGGLTVMFSEVLKKMIEGHWPLVEGGLAVYLIQAVVELFETLISFLSNSLSYVRVGAFAVAHVGLSAVVYILANLASANHGIGYWIAVVLGNLFIVGFEGLIVGIQTMRLEYYEFFSKFFIGGGLAYKPLKQIPVEKKV